MKVQWLQFMRKTPTENILVGLYKVTQFFSKPGKTRKINWKKIMRNNGLQKRWIDYSSPLHIHFGITVRCYLICFDIILFNGLNFYERLIASKWFCLPYAFLSFVSRNRIKHLIPFIILVYVILYRWTIYRNIWMLNGHRKTYKPRWITWTKLHYLINWT